MCILAQALALLHHFSLWSLVPWGREELLHPLCCCAPSSLVPGTAGLRGGVGRELGWRVTGFYVGHAVLCNWEWAWVWVLQALCLHTCQCVDVLGLFASGVCVNGVGDVWG